MPTYNIATHLAYLTLLMNVLLTYVDRPDAGMQISANQRVLSVSQAGSIMSSLRQPSVDDKMSLRLTISNWEQDHIMYMNQPPGRHTIFRAPHQSSA